MKKKLRILAIIPARAGSKGVQDKNIKPLNGKPLLAWTVLEAKKLGFLDCIHVSTDSKKYAAVAVRYGADVSFLRPRKLALDGSRVGDTLLFVLKQFELMGREFDLIVSLPPTTPLRNATDIRNAFELLFKKDAQGVVSVCETDYHPLWCNTLNKNLSMKNFLRPGIEHKNRQELPKYYRLNGAIYLAYCDFLKKNRSFYGPRTYAYIMPKERSVDINERIDFAFAESLMRSQKRK